jgi:endonuclease-3
MKNQEKVTEILKRLKKKYKEPKTALNFKTPFELLASTILSAQTTDTIVNKVTEKLFKKYKSIKDYADVPLQKLQQDINSINFYKTKAKNIQNAAQMTIEKFNANVPRTMEELISLPGVARKTANIVLYNAYNVNEGIAVDTHVKRLASRLGLTKTEDPVKIERDLIEVTPQKEWGAISHLLIFHGRTICQHLLIFHGRTICQAKKPRHNECILYDICPSRNI